MAGADNLHFECTSVCFVGSGFQVRPGSEKIAPFWIGSTVVLLISRVEWSPKAFGGHHSTLDIRSTMVKAIQSGVILSEPGRFASAAALSMRAATLFLPLFILSSLRVPVWQHEPRSGTWIARFFPTFQLSCRLLLFLPHCSWMKSRTRQKSPKENECESWLYEV